MIKKYCLFFIGIQGSGKGTQIDLLAKKVDAKVFEVGEFLRQKSKENTKIGRYIKKKIDDGELVADEILLALIEENLKNIRSKLLIFDGIPRTVPQAEMIFNLISKKGYTFIIVYLDLKKSAAVKRLLLRRRIDDKPKIIKERIKNFFNRTLPIVKKFDKKVIFINGDQTVEAVHKEIVAKLSARKIIHYER